MSSAIQVPFSASWIQALTVVADHPDARGIKPKLELVNSLVLARPETDRLGVATELWELAKAQGLTELLEIVPTGSTPWIFESDEAFVYARVQPALTAVLQPNAIPANQPPSSQPPPYAGNLEHWQRSLGLLPGEIPLVAEAFQGDWASLVRKEAVRLQQSFSMSAVGAATTLHLPCTAAWDTRAWAVSFEQVPWVVKRYDELPRVPRPQYAEMEDLLTWLVATSGEAAVQHKSPKCDLQAVLPPWIDCVPALSPLHCLLCKTPGDFSPWLRRVWQCVWPIVYREQQVLKERADLQFVRHELKICMTSQPKLCGWMFLFAKLVCQTQLGTGLGFCADYHD